MLPDPQSRRLLRQAAGVLRPPNLRNYLSSSVAGILYIGVGCEIPLPSPSPEHSSPFLQSEALQQLRKDSESIRSRYAHYFDLSLVNNGVEESLQLLQEAFEQACSSPQWVPVSWVY